MNVDLGIFVAFLIVNIGLGLYSSRGIKNIKEYAIGNRNFSTITITATIVATWISGNSFGMAAFDSHNEGIFFLIPGLADAISLLTIGYFIAPRVGEFLGTLSVADAMGTLYGQNVRTISAISAIIPAIGNIAIQFVILIGLLSEFLGVSGIYATVISSIVVISYSTFGGIKAITFTDTIQFFTFGVIIPIIAFIIWRSIGDIEAISNVLNQHPIFDYKSLFDYQNPNFIKTILIFLFFSIPGLDPALFQRISMARNTHQVAKSFVSSGIIIFFCIYTVLWFIGILVLTDSNIHFTPSNLIAYILNNYLDTGFKGLFVVSIMAMIMSTADSYINCSAVMFTHDFCQPLGLKLTEKNQLLVTKISALFIGVSALLLSLYSKNLIHIILSTYSFYMPIVSVPLLLAIFGFRSNSQTVLIGMLAGFCTVIYFKFFTQIDSLIPGMIANTIFFVGSHYLLGAKGGFIGIKDQASLDVVKKQRRERLSNIVYKIKNFNLIKFYHNNLPRSESIYVFYGFFCLISIFASIYSIETDIYNSHNNIIDWSYYLTLIIATTFITYQIWSPRFRSEVFISVLWTLSIMYNLVFTSSLLVLVNKFSQLHLIILMANLITAAILLRWQVALWIMPLGVYLSSIFYQYQIGPIPSDINDPKQKVVYALLFVCSILIAFLKPKQEMHEIVQEEVEHLNTRIQHREEEFKKFNKTRNALVSTINARLSEKTSTIKEASKILIHHLSEDSDVKLDSDFQNSLISAIYETSINLWSPTYDNVHTSLNINNIINEAISIKANSISDKSININTKLSDNLPDILTDELCAKLLLIGFLSYTIEGIPNGSIINISSNLIKLENKEGDKVQNKEFISVTFTDNGFGISPEERQSLDRKHNANNGNALDHFNPPLDNLLQIVTMLACECSIEPILGKGTTIILNIPLRLSTVADKEKNVNKSKARIIPFKAV